MNTQSKLVLVMLGLSLLLFGCGDEEGTIDFSTTESDRSYYALSFDGSSDYLQTPSEAMTYDISTDSLSFGMWVIPYNIGSQMGMFSMTNGSNGMQITIEPTGVVRLYATNGTNSRVIWSSEALTADNPYFVGVMLNPSSSEIHINGGEDDVSSDTGSVSFGDNSWQPKVGCDYESGAKFYGKIHAVAVWNGEMTGDDFAKVYNNGELGFDLSQNSSDGQYNMSSDLASWWKLGEDSSNIGKDYGSNSLNLDGVSLDSNDIVSYP